MLKVGAISSCKGVHHLLCICCIVSATQQVVADSLEVRIVSKVEDAF